MGKRKSRLGSDCPPEEQVDFLINEAHKAMEKGNYGGAEFKANEASNLAKSLLGFDHPMTGKTYVDAAHIYIASAKIGKARQLCEQALTIADQCDDHALKARAYSGLGEVAIRTKTKHKGEKAERTKLSQEYRRLQMEEEARAVKFPAKPPPPTEEEEEEEYQPPPPAKAQKVERDDYYQPPSKTAKKKEKEKQRRQPVGRDREWALIKDREEKDREIHEREKELEEQKAPARPPDDLSEYSELEGGDGWQSSPCGKWLYHKGSNVFLQQATRKYFRKGADGEINEIRQEKQEVTKEEPQKVQQFEGTVKTLVEKKGYGFIKQDGALKDVWVKMGGGLTLKEGMRVRYKIGRVDGRDCAVDLVILAEPVPVAKPERVVEHKEEDVLEERPLFDIWGRPVKQKVEVKIVKEEKPSWDREVKSGVELLRGRSMCMEDYHAREQLGTLGTMFAIFDGHGGRDCSEFCSANFGKYVEIEFRKKFPLDSLKEKKTRETALQPLPEARCPEKAPPSYLSEILVAGFLAADKAFLEATGPQDGREAVRAGTTANVCFLRGPSRDRLQLITANVGDSRAVLCRGGKAVRLSDDHKPDRKDERQRIEEAGGSVLELGGSWRCTKGSDWGSTRYHMPETQLLLATSRALGDRELKEADVVSAVPEITVENIGRDDFFVILASDGIWDILSDQEACDVALKYFGDPDKMARAIAQEALKDEANNDNSSALIVQFGWNGDRLKGCLKKEAAAKKKQAAKVVDMFASDDD